MAACLQQGYRDPVGDIANFVRVAQMPLFAMCFISFLRRGGGKIYKAVETGLWVNFTIITVSVVLSVITGTYKPTYIDSNLGVLGWYSTSNAQSAIMSILTPLLVMLAYRSKNDKLLIATTAAAFAQLYFLGTRLAFMAMAVTLGGLVIVMLLRREFKWKPVIIVGVCFLACCAFIKVSPMVKNRDFKLVKKVLIIAEPIIAAFCIIVFIFAKPLCIWFFGADYGPVAPILRVMLTFVPEPGKSISV